MLDKRGIGVTVPEGGADPPLPPGKGSEAQIWKDRQWNTDLSETQKRRGHLNEETQQTSTSRRFSLLGENKLEASAVGSVHDLAFTFHAEKQQWQWLSDSDWLREDPCHLTPSPGCTLSSALIIQSLFLNPLPHEMGLGAINGQFTQVRMGTDLDKCVPNLQRADTSLL